MDDKANIRQDGDASKTTTDETVKASADEDMGQGGGRGGVKPRPRIGGAKSGPPKAGAKKSAAKKAAASKSGAAKGKTKAAGTLVEVARAIGGGIGSAVGKVSSLLPGGGAKKGSAKKAGAAKKGAKKSAAKSASKAGAKKAPAKKSSTKSSKGGSK